MTNAVFGTFGLTGIIAGEGSQRTMSLKTSTRWSFFQMKFSFAFATLAFASASQALTLTFDNPSVVIDQPHSTVIVTFNGTLVKAANETFTGSQTDPLRHDNPSGPVYSLLATSAFLAANGGSTANYHGPILEVSVPSSVWSGHYEGSFSYHYDVTTVDSTTPHTVFQDVQMTVNAVPEPSSVAVLGLGAVALLRRKRRQ